MDKRLDPCFHRGMTTPLLLPKLELPAILEALETQVVVAAEPIELWNRLVCEHHYLENANLVGEQLRYVVTYQGQWVALLGWSAATASAGRFISCCRSKLWKIVRDKLPRACQTRRHDLFCPNKTDLKT